MINQVGNPIVVWLTGLSGSGKSTLALGLRKKLEEQNVTSILLDGDHIRKGLCQDLGFSKADRAENIRRVSEVARLMHDTGLVVIVALISPLEVDRENARQIIGDQNFYEVFVECPLDICEKRDVKGLYKKVRNGEIDNFTGISSKYEIPQNPFLIVNTDENSIEDSLNSLYKSVAKHILV